MKLKILLLTLLLSTSLIGASYANFQDGLDVYDRGDYKAAVNEWKSLVKNGNAIAQYNLGLVYENTTGVLQSSC